MKNINILLLLLFVIFLPLQISCAQDTSCPSDNEQAKQVLKEYFSKERNIKSMQDQYDMAVDSSTKKNIISLTGEAYKEECKQMIANLNWLSDQQHYSIYKVANHYFIVLYSYNKNGEFKMKEIPIINREFEALGSIINF